MKKITTIEELRVWYVADLNRRKVIGFKNAQAAVKNQILHDIDLGIIPPDLGEKILAEAAAASPLSTGEHFDVVSRRLGCGPRA